MINEEITKQLLSYIQLSNMDSREKAMWMLILPHMEEKHVLKLKAALEKEANSLIDIYIQATKSEQLQQS
jgi:hypothetical protein